MFHSKIIWGEGPLGKPPKMPKITILPEWVPDVGETIQLVFEGEFRAEENYSKKTRIRSIDTKVEEVICHEEDNLRDSADKTYLLVVSVMSRKCWVKLSQNSPSRFDEAQINHNILGLPNEFYVLRFPKCSGEQSWLANAVSGKSHRGPVRS